MEYDPDFYYKVPDLWHIGGINQVTVTGFERSISGSLVRIEDLM